MILSPSIVRKVFMSAPHVATQPSLTPGDANNAARPGGDVSHAILDNGLEVVIIPDTRTPVVTHMIWYKNGSADDPLGKSGIAHFLEHLMFKGTKKHPQGEFSNLVAELGGQDCADPGVRSSRIWVSLAKISECENQPNHNEAAVN